MRTLKFLAILLLSTLCIRCDSAGPDRDTVPGRLAGSWILDTTMDSSGNRTSAFRNQIGSVFLEIDDISSKARADYQFDIRDPGGATTTIQGTYLLMENDRGNGILLDHRMFGGLNFSVAFDGEDTLILTIAGLGEESLMTYGFNFPYTGELIWTFQRK